MKENGEWTWLHFDDCITPTDITPPPPGCRRTARNRCRHRERRRRRTSSAPRAGRSITKVPRAAWSRTGTATCAAATSASGASPGTSGSRTSRRCRSGGSVAGACAPAIANRSFQELSSPVDPARRAGSIESCSSRSTSMRGWLGRACDPVQHEMPASSPGARRVKCHEARRFAEVRQPTAALVSGRVENLTRGCAL